MKKRANIQPSVECHHMTDAFCISLRQSQILFISRLLPPGISIQPSCLHGRREMQKDLNNSSMGELLRWKDRSEKQDRGQCGMVNINLYTSNESDGQNMKVSNQLVKAAKVKVKMKRQDLISELTEAIKCWLVSKNLIMNFTSQLEIIGNRTLNLTSNSKRLIFGSLRKIVRTIEKDENIKKYEIQTMKSIIQKCYLEYSGFQTGIHYIYVWREHTLEQDMQRGQVRYGKKKEKGTALTEKKLTKRKSLESIEQSMQRDQSTILTQSSKDSRQQTNQEHITIQEATAIHDILRTLPQPDQRRLISTLHNDQHNLNLIRNLKKAQVDRFVTKIQQILSKRSIFYPERSKSEEQRKCLLYLGSQRE